LQWEFGAILLYKLAIFCIIQFSVMAFINFSGVELHEAHLGPVSCKTENSMTITIRILNAKSWKFRHVLIITKPFQLAHLLYSNEKYCWYGKNNLHYIPINRNSISLILVIQMFCGAIASIMPSTCSVESDFSLINWTTDPNLQSLSDFSLESILHCKQHWKLRDMFK